MENKMKMHQDKPPKWDQYKILPNLLNDFFSHFDLFYQKNINGNQIATKTSTDPHVQLKAHTYTYQMKTSTKFGEKFLTT